MRKALKYTGISLLVFILLLFFIPIVFKSKIVSLVKTEINKNIEATVNFKDVSLSVFRHFPKLSIALEDISIIGLHEFKKDTLLSASTLDASVNILSVIKGNDMKVYGVYLQSPRIHALVNKDGRANWEITKGDTTGGLSSGESSAFKMNLEQYEIKDGYIVYDDQQAGMRAEIASLDHEGSGNFTEEIFTLSTKTTAGTANFTYANVPYLVNTKTGINAELEIDNKTSKYSFKDAAISVNELKLVADGFVQLDNDSTYSMDLKFDAPSNEFKNILSLVPAIYKTDFDKLKTSGTAAFKGFVKGVYSPQQLPAYKIDMDIKDGFFQYPDLPQPVKNIQLTAQIANPDGVTDHTVVDVKKGHIEMGGEPFDFRVLFRNPETSRYIDALIKGKLNLADVSKFIKLDGATKLAGTVWADVFAKGNLSALEQKGGAFQAGGFLDIKNLFYASKDFPQPIQNGNFKIQVENNGGVADATTIAISQGHMEVGKDPVDFTLNLSKPVSDVNFSGTAKGKFTLDNIKQFVALEAGTSIGGLLHADMNFSGSKADVDKKNYERIQANGVIDLANVAYSSKDYPDGIRISAAQLKFNPQNVALNNFEGDFQKTHISANGVLKNMIGYALREEELSGNINVATGKVNLNDWMGTDTVTTTGTASSAPFLVPANMTLTINAQADAVEYDKVNYDNVKGVLLLKEETVRLQNVQAEALGGTMNFDGSYSTRLDKTRPDINLSYSVKNIDVQKAFFAYNTIQKLMPIGRFLSGRLTSQFNMLGKLNGDMFPDLATLTGKGNLLVIEGALSKFQPLEKLANMLSVETLKGISLKDIKSHFEFANGKVLVKPFNVKVQEIDMQIGGVHGLDQSIDYIIGMKLPRKYLGTSGNSLINNLASQASSKGIPVNMSETVNLNVKMGGTINNPAIKADLKEAAGDMTKELKQQAAGFVQQKVDSTKQTIKDSVNVVKKQVVNDVKTELVKQLSGTRDSANQGSSIEGTKEKATQTLKNTFGNLLKKKKASTDSTKSAGQ